MFSSIPWKRLSVALCLMAVVVAVPALAEEAGGPKHRSFLDNAKDAGFMEYILLLVSIAGFALCLQALVTLRAHLMRPPELANELLQIVQENNTPEGIEQAIQAAQSDPSFLGSVAFATLSAHPYGKDGMEGAMSDMGEIETHKVMNKIGTLNLIAAIAPMLGLTGTTVGMIETFSAMSAGGAEITPDKMAKGISIALICTFTGLIVAIPLLVVAFLLKARVTQVIYEVSNDCNELIRVTTAGQQA